ncbi:MAG: hypothetical protein PHI64_11010 [Zoogloea sp.]|nr:hypothetical protein [Zoogloea sp.]MDD2989474.1 hypothetical protein [Zoogloea sp.]
MSVSPELEAAITRKKHRADSMPASSQIKIQAQGINFIEIFFIKKK